MAHILLLFVSTLAKGQFYQYGQDAGNLKWFQFNTPHYRVIYPVGVDSLAHSFVQLLEYYYPHLGKPLDHQPGNIPVIVHNESSFSNGVFAWAPKRLEIFTNPDPNGYPQDWLAQLALHEARHSVQIDKLDQGVTHVFSWFLGEQAAGAAAVFLPFWYLEGDAVDAETRFSKTGRGRLPGFSMELKAHLLENDQPYSFSKAVLGSYRDHVPDHYKLGYALVRHGRERFGDEFWIRFQQFAARKPYLINPTHFSMKEFGYRSKSSFYREAMAAYGQRWHLQDSSIEFTPSRRWTAIRGKDYTSYTFPHSISEHLLLAYKSGIDQIPGFILLGSNGEETSLFQPGFMSSGRVSCSGNHVVWDEFIPDTRWSNRNYSVIRSYDIGTGETRYLGRRTRYYSPAISTFSSRIVAVEQSEVQTFSLVVLDLEGNVERKIPTPGNLFAQQPGWMESDSALMTVLTDGKGKSLYVYSMESGQWSRLFSSGFEDMSYPVMKGGQIFFSATYSGVDNIYCYDLEEKTIRQVTSVRYGASYPQLSGKGDVLFYSSYTDDGYDVASLRLEDGSWKPVEEVAERHEEPGFTSTEEEMKVIREAPGPDTAAYVHTRYAKWLNLFHFHSWLPGYVDYLNPELSLQPGHLPLSPGISILSQNLLSTAVTQLGYEYRNGFHLFHSGIRFSGRYPVLNLYFDYGGEPRILLLNEGDSITNLPNDVSFRVQTYIPFRFSTGKFITVVQPRIDYTYRRDIQYVESAGRYREGAHYLYYSIFGTSYLRRGVRDFITRLGVSATAGYYHAPFDNQVYGSVARAGITCYIPGLANHHVLRISLDHQKQYPVDRSRPAFLNLMGIPRGLHGIFGGNLTRYSLDYFYPLYYPDLELTSLLYVKRLRGAAWLDHMNGTDVIITEPDPHYEDRAYSTMGMDLVADMNLFRIPFPFSFGGRFIYHPDTGKLNVEAIYSIRFN